MKWAYQIRINDSGIKPGIYRTRTKRDARIWAEKWASTGIDTWVLKQKDFDPDDPPNFLRGWDVIEGYGGGDGEIWPIFLN
jgi:hypothetical protein